MSLELIAAVAAMFALAVASGVIPLINAEVVLITAVLAAPGPFALAALLLVLAAATGQMVAKSAVYLGGVGIARMSRGGLREAIERYRARCEARSTAPMALLFVSATVGIPPFYVVSVIAGSLSISFARFVAVGFIGRLVRFAAVAAAPEMLQLAFS